MRPGLAAWVRRREALSEHLPQLLAVLAPSLRRYRWRFVALLALLPISATMAVLLPYLTKVAIDEHLMPAVDAGDAVPFLEPLRGLVMLALVVVVLGYLADALYVQLLQRTGQRMLAELRDTVYAHSLRLPRRFYDRMPTGALLTRVTSDIEALGETLASNVLSFLVNLLKTVAFLAMMLYLSWRLTLVVLLVGPLLFGILRFSQLRVRAAYFRARQALADATGYLQECLNGMKTVQLYAAEAEVVRRFDVRNRRFLLAQNQSNIYDAILGSVVEGLTTVAIAAVLWFAAGGLIAGVVTIGVLVAFIEYIQRLFVPIRELSQQLAVLQRAMAALDHIAALLVAQPDPAEMAPGLPGQKVTRPPGFEPAGGLDDERFESLVFEGVEFRYAPDAPLVLAGVDLTLSRGETLAIVGATGSGKSTIVRLITREYGAYEGSIRLNDRELTRWSRDALERRIAVVQQSVFLFRGSIAFNIGLGRPGIDRAAVERAARYVHAHEFIETLERGYDTEVLDAGANFSAGQAQLIAFARAVAGDAEVIVLDEATSAVDSLTEQLIEQALGSLYRDKTVIAIAHRLSTIRNADEILVMEAGRVVEAGSHLALVARGGRYAALLREGSASRPWSETPVLSSPEA